jgi:NADH:ubiquinone oxidoreductase subunit E
VKFNPRFAKSPVKTRLPTCPGDGENSRGFNVPAADVYGLATFYNQFRLNPPGKHQVKVCMGTACYMVGGDITLESFERRMEIKEKAKPA